MSGSRGPAERAQLVAIVAGRDEVVSAVTPALQPMSRAVVPVGEVPRALEMKLAVNTFLITLVAGLAESFRLAESKELDLALFHQIIAAGPMASDVSSTKLDKLADGDLAPQAALSDGLYNARLIEAAAAAGAGGGAVPAG